MIYYFRGLKRLLSSAPCEVIAMASGLFVGLRLWVLVHVAVKPADKPAAKLARGLFVGLWLWVLVRF